MRHTGIVQGHPVKAEQVRGLLKSTRYSPADIAGIVGCSYQLVTKIRRELRLPSEREKLLRRMARIEQELRDMRTQISCLETIIREQHAAKKLAGGAPLAKSKKEISQNGK